MNRVLDTSHNISFVFGSFIRSDSLPPSLPGFDLPGFGFSGWGLFGFGLSPSFPGSFPKPNRSNVTAEQIWKMQTTATGVD
jgi:hypothetical protein